MDPLLQIFIAWVAVSTGLISIGHNADQWMGAEGRQEFAEKLRTALMPDWGRWVRAVNSAFITVFDAVYRRRFPELERAVWQSVLCSYGIVAIARVILKLFTIPVPPTSQILTVAFVVAVGGTFFVQAFRKGGELFTRVRMTSMSHGDILRSRELYSVLAYGFVALLIYTAAAMLTGYGLGISTRSVIAVSIGAAFGLPLMMAITLIPERFLPVSPLAALLSSILSLLLLAVLFPVSAKTFLDQVATDHWKAGCLVLFNLFADMISLVETRWVLHTSAKQPALFGIIIILLLDLLLSAAIFFVLPGIADQKIDVLLSGILFRGPLPWTGILFWSTFATSLLFYLFVGAVLLLKCLTPVAKGIRLIDRWFPMYDHPVRLVAISMTAIAGMCFLAVLITRIVATEGTTVVP